MLCGRGHFFESGEPYGSGHIHDTFRIETRETKKIIIFFRDLIIRFSRTFLNFSKI